MQQLSRFEAVFPVAQQIDAADEDFSFSHARLEYQT